MEAGASKEREISTNDRVIGSIKTNTWKTPPNARRAVAVAVARYRRRRRPRRRNRNRGKSLAPEGSSDAGNVRRRPNHLLQQVEVERQAERHIHPDDVITAGFSFPLFIFPIVKNATGERVLEIPYSPIPSTQLFIYRIVTFLLCGRELGMVAKLDLCMVAPEQGFGRFWRLLETTFANCERNCCTGLGSSRAAFCRQSCI